LERVRGPRHQDQNVKKRERDGYAPSANAGYSSRIGQRADEMDDKRKDTDYEQLGIHVLITRRLIAEVEIMRDQAVCAKSHVVCRFSSVPG
jgi:hypothetical protein